MGALLLDALRLALLVGAVAYVARAFARAWLPRAPRADRALAAVVIGFGLVSQGVRLLGALSLLRPWLALVALALLVAVAALLDRRWPAPARSTREVAPLGPRLLVGGVVVLAVFAAVVLPIFQWDALGYHLPFVMFALQGHSFAAVPPDVPYLSTYPHGVEYVYIALRMALSSDRLLDLGQLPFALAGAAAIVRIARRAGARPTPAYTAAAAWLCLPAVFLQLASNYVDIAVAAYLLLAAWACLGRLDARRVILAGVALGLLAGAKLNAPISAALLFAVLAWRARGKQLWPWLGVAAAIALVLGGEALLVNALRHGNPVWPVQLSLGPLHLPGIESVEDLMAAAAHVPHPSGPWPVRALRSWFSLHETPSYDMRLGGLGPLFWLALPPAVLALRKRRLRIAIPVVLAAIVPPDIATARMVLAVPALVLALAAATVSTWRLRRAVCTGVALAAALSAALASFSLSGPIGPSVYALAGMAPAARVRALDPEEAGRSWAPLRDGAAGAVIAYQGQLELPYLLWRDDGSNTVVRVPDHLAPAALAAFLVAHHVTTFVSGDDRAFRAIATARNWCTRAVWQCLVDPCTAYELAPANPAGACPFPASNR